MPRGIPNLKPELDSRSADRDLPPLRIDDIGDKTIDPSEVFKIEQLELEAFMNEMVTIHVHESNDENAPEVEYVAVEGVRQFVARGKTQTIRRKYVERLARAKKTTFAQNLDHTLGERMNVLNPRSAVLIPFSVEEDTPKGRAWLRAIFAEAA